MSGNNGSAQSLASTTASGNGHPATTVSMAMGANGTMSFAGLNGGNIPTTFRSRMGSLTSFSAHPASPLTPHTPVPDGIMASNLIPQMSVWNNSPNPAHMQSLMNMNKDYGLAAAGSPTAMHFGSTPFRSGDYAADQSDKCIVILTPKVAQKSYGSEKRFLCPPPTVLLLGSGWCIPPPYHLQSTGANVQSLLSSTGPRLMVGIPNESASQQPTIEWVGGGLKMNPGSNGGEQINPGDPDHSITGRCVSKNLYINEADEKRKKVEVYVKVHAPQGELLGTFHSKPIKVISKPSKKRQSLKNIELCIHHGSTVSLFNRLRSQTVSTKYLSVSNSIASGGPRPNWSNVANAPLNPENTCFVARTNLWDPFIIWIVDPNQSLGDVMNYHNSPPIPGYPPPPTIAIHPRRPPDFAMVDNGMNGSGVDGGSSSGAGGTSHGGPVTPTPSPPIPIHYNQTVVLQCLSTGMVSPVMIIRKVERGSMVVGGMLSSETGKEVLGDPVSQLHKVAFEIYDGSSMTTHMYPNGDVGSYLACLTDVVGTQPSKGGKKPYSHLATPPNSTDGEVSPTTPKHLVGAGNPHPGAMAAGNGSVDGTGFHYGGSVLSHDDTLGPLLTMGGSGHLASTGKTVHKGQKRNSMSRHSGGHDSACAVAWVEDAQDLAIWTIVGSESSQYTIKGGNLTTPGLSSVVPTGYDMGLLAGNNQHPAAAGMMAPPPSTHHDPHGVNNFAAMGAEHHHHHHHHHSHQHHPSALLSPIKVEGEGQDGNALGEAIHQSPFSPAFNHNHHHSLGGLVGNGPPTVTQVIVGEHDQGASGTSAPGAERSDSAGDGQGSGGQSSSAQDTRKVVTIFGENFQPKMKVWFGQYPSPHVEWRSSQAMVCLAPMVGDAHGPTADMRGMNLLISLGLPEHEDMVVPTNQTFTL
ncbi:hypothetical protein IWQ62_002391 [Dispira parvispora]|uniref:LAG1-DNAbind-domain-containing protein n=1 Tax=Dispira parvispora TaxID=1520584 RepID=A0A9W8AW59_9FUNG|nr:hypothetical protein IWQ62_002391 [Dispira parvispora]